MKTPKTPFLTKIVKLAFVTLLVVTLNSCVDKPIYKGKPENAISVKKAQELCNNFDTRHDTISALIGKPDNRSSWHSIKEIEQYIAYIKKEGQERGLNVNGIRIYFGAYGPKEVGRENYSTLFLVPTVKGRSNTVKGVKNFAAVDTLNRDTYDIDPLNLGEAGNPPSKKYK